MKNLILGALLLLSTISFSQDRVNREKQEFTSSSIKLDQATGWAYNKDEGSWVEYQNIISSNSYKNYPSLRGGSYHKSRSTNTFEYLQIKKLILEGQTFYFLLIDAIEGSYKYPSIQEDWEQYKVLKAYIFSEEEFNKLKNYQQANVLYSIPAGSYDYKTGEETIINKFQTAFSDGYVTTPVVGIYSLNVKKSDDGKNVRFLLPERSSYPTDFNNNYFEVDIQKFQQLFILN
jgi:hypothetical protein